MERRANGCRATGMSRKKKSRKWHFPKVSRYFFRYLQILFCDVFLRKLSLEILQNYELVGATPGDANSSTRCLRARALGAALCGTGAFPFPPHFPLRVAAAAAAAYVTETAPAPLTNPFRMGHKFFNVSHASNMSRRGSDLVCRLIISNRKVHIFC